MTDARSPLRPRTDQPRSIRVEALAGRVLLVRRWFTPAVLLMVGFCFFWNGFLVFWYALAAQVPTGGPGPSLGMKIVFLLLPLVFVAVGLLVAYGTAAALLNRTTIELDCNTLSVRHGPVPWSGNCNVRTQDVRQLYVQRSRERGRRRAFYTYDLSAVLSDGRKIHLLRGLTDPDEATFLEQELERVLKLPDERVRGEARL